MKNINVIQRVKVIEKHFDVVRLETGNAWCEELTLDGITTYHIDRGSRKRLDVAKIPVDKEEMKSFFAELYEFVRNASDEGITIDDCSHEVQITYSEFHKEIFQGWTGTSNESLIGKIHGFVSLHR